MPSRSREGPVREQLGDLLGHGQHAIDAGAEVDDEDAVGVEVLVALLVVVGVDERGRAAVGGLGAVMRILGEDLLDAEGRAPFLLVGGVGGVVDLADDAAAMGLALVLGHVADAGQGRELDVEAGGELPRLDVLASGPGAVLATAVVPGAAQEVAVGESGDAVAARPHRR